jgi:hypothetical protein
MDPNEPIKTERTFSLDAKEDVAKAMQDFQSLVFELYGKKVLPCEIHVQVIFIRGGCPC